MDLFPPPENKVYSSLQELVNDVNTHAAPQGYAVVKARIKKGKDDTVQRAYIVRDKGGKDRPLLTTDARKRRTQSRRTECPFSIVAKEDDIDWTFTIRHGEHNHIPTGPSSYPAHRKLKPEAIQAIADHILAGDKAGVIVNKLRITNSNQLMKNQDVYNAKAAIRRERLGPYTPTQVLMTELAGNDHFFMAYKKDPDTNKLTHLFFVYDKCQELLESNPEVLVIDATYKTNGYGLPLVNIFGITTLGTTFYVGFAFI